MLAADPAVAELSTLDHISVAVPDVVIQSHPTSVVSGVFDVVFDVPDGVEEDLRRYQITLSLAPLSSGVSFTGAAEPAKPVFASRTPQVDETGNRLLARDNLP